MARAHAPCHRHAATMAQLSVLVAVVSAVAARRTIRPGVPWFDTDGNLLDAHGAGILEHEGRFYWYGSRRTVNATGTQMDGGIALYSSTDLYSWKFESLVVAVFNCSSPSTKQLLSQDAQQSNLGAAYPPPSCKVRHHNP